MKKQSLWRKLQDTQKSMIDAQSSILNAARFTERMYNLWNWTHPWKSCTMLIMIIMGTVAALVIPNKYAIAMGISQQFLKGLKKKLFPKKVHQVKGASALDADTIQVSNLTP